MAISHVFVIGESIGSVRIDEAFQEEVERRLELIRSKISDHSALSKRAPREMVRKFEAFKQVFGEERLVAEEYYFRVPGLPEGFDDEDAKISGGRMVFT